MDEEGFSRGRAVEMALLMVGGGIALSASFWTARATLLGNLVAGSFIVFAVWFLGIIASGVATSIGYQQGERRRVLGRLFIAAIIITVISWPLYRWSISAYPVLDLGFFSQPLPRIDGWAWGQTWKLVPCLMAIVMVLCSFALRWDSIRVEQQMLRAYQKPKQVAIVHRDHPALPIDTPLVDGPSIVNASLPAFEPASRPLGFVPQSQLPSHLQAQAPAIQGHLATPSTPTAPLLVASLPVTYAAPTATPPVPFTNQPPISTAATPVATSAVPGAPRISREELERLRAAERQLLPELRVGLALVREYGGKEISTRALGAALRHRLPGLRTEPRSIFFKLKELGLVYNDGPRQVYWARTIPGLWEPN